MGALTALDRSSWNTFPDSEQDSNAGVMDFYEAVRERASTDRGCPYTRTIVTRRPCHFLFGIVRVPIVF